MGGWFGFFVVGVVFARVRVMAYTPSCHWCAGEFAIRLSRQDVLGLDKELDYIKRLTMKLLVDRR